ncbi:septin and tuftelin-interacting protein 1 homolog 1 [Selaginella moellendorffii]|uniref:septin and tuftelin-interacting protein 1 homolog 1 n=1 Tax=Selaginella moellendorffii TaxID=88036 RepID=UPI000D1CD2A3|nr:septin and tuftelin-interacting protein 1 homolog 1 [Selaginella moellendorffii]|eukprot:XP_024545504.1 septin and tuftelin-interacting protein 1 homolog 1 [Selaginella moellendorffii]
MEDEERQNMERFSTEGDFVDGEWIDGEFYYRSRRKRRGQTKEEALYGYQSSGSDSDGGGGGRRGRKKRRGGIIVEDKSSKPVNFVSASVQDVGTENQASSSSRKEMEEEEEEEEVPGAGLGFRASSRDRGSDEGDERGGVGLGFQRGGIGFQADGDEPGGAGTGFQRGGIGFQASNEEGDDQARNEDGVGGRGGLGFQRGGIGFQARSEDGDGRGGVGLGFQRGGIGFQARNVDADGRAGVGLGFQGNGAASAGDDDDGDLELPSALGKKIQEKVRQKTKKKPGGPASSSSVKYVWQKHTSEFTNKMMSKMGLTGGTGLGKNLQGRVAAIEVKLRPKNMGMGYNDFQEVTTGRDDPAAATESEEVAHRSRANEQLWMKKNKKKAKTFVSAEELLSRQQGRTVGKVLDMTGPQVRVVTDMKDLNAERMVVEEDDTPMPELQHNLKLLVDLVASDIQQYDSRLRHDKQTIAILEKDRDRLQKELELQSRSLEVMHSITSAIEGVQQEAASRRLTLDGLLKTFAKLKAEFPEEYKLWNLSALALSHAAPRITSHFQAWQPLLQPSRGVDVLLPWMELLQEQEEEAIFTEVDTAPYSRLVMETVLPHINRAVINWEAREPEPLLRVLEVWEKLLPASVFQSVLDSCVMPKLRAQVEAWDPLQDTVPVHHWVHPWLPLLGSRMDPVCDTIRWKLNSVLQAWDPSDVSAYLMLSPWHSVFDAASWEQLLARNIVPKLKVALEQLEINPAQQRLEPFSWVMAWAPVMPLRLMIRMLEEKFFPKWHHALFAWLGSNPDFDEVTQWYQGWKSVLPAELLANDRVRWQLNGALEMMNQAVEGAPLVMRDAEQWQQQFVEKKFAAVAVAVAEAEAEMSLKEVVESFAQEKDVQFLPKPGRLHQGLQVYGFGSVSIAVDNHKQAVLAQAGQKWTSVSLEQLLEIHHARKGGKWNS